MKLSELLEHLEIIEVAGPGQGEIISVCYNSKRCDSNALFVAVSGLTRDGHAYIPEALARGARVVVHEKDFTPPPGVTAVKVTDSRRALGILGRNLYRHPSAQLCLIGVTGTNGKTTVTYLLEAILEAAGCQVGVLGTVNYRYGGRELPAPNTTPESVELQKILREMADSGVTHVIAEVSSHALELRRVDECAFDLGIFTNLTQDHLDFHGAMEKYFQAKLRFFKAILPGQGKRRPIRMIINGDDPWGKKIVQEVAGPSLTYGLERGNLVWGELFSLSVAGLEASMHWGSGSLNLFSPLIGRFNLYNILAAATAALALHVPVRFIEEGIEGLQGVPGRLERVSRPGEPAVFVDYAHTPDALLRVLQNLTEFREGRIITLFGCGGDRDRGKRPLMGGTAVSFSDVTIITSDNPRGENPLEIIEEIEKGIDVQKVRKVSPAELAGIKDERCFTVFPDRKEAIELAVDIAGPGDTLLIAGKGHEDYQIVGEQRFPFDDRKVARQALDRKKKD